MTTILSMLLGNIVPQLGNVIKGIFDLKKDTSDKTQELELAKLQILLQEKKIDIDKETSFAKYDAETSQAISEAIIKMNEANVERSKIKTGIKWVDCIETVVRNLFGLTACGVLLIAVMQAVHLNSPIWQATALWDLVGAIVGYFVGYGTSAFTQKKVNS